MLIKEGANLRNTGADLTQGRIFPTVFSLAVPIMLTSILQLLFNAADLVIVGNYCGPDSVAAVGATTSLTTLITNIFIGLSVGSSVAVAHAYGAHDDKTMHKTVHTAIFTAVVAGIVLAIVGITFCETFLEWMGTPKDIIPKSAIYMKINFGGIIFNMLYNYSAAILRSVGDTRSPLVYLTAAGIINVILNIFFVTRLDMDVAGVSLATTISQAVSATLVLIALIRRTDACRLYIREIKFHKDEFKKIMSVGIPAGIQGSMFSISNVVIQSSINSFDKVFMSGSSAAASIEGFVYVILNSFMQASVSFTGQNYGARKFTRLKKGFRSCLVGVLLVGIPVCLLVYFFREPLLSIYINKGTAEEIKEAITAGSTRMSLICLPYFICGLMDVTTGAVRGLGASFVTMLISIIGVVGIRVGWIATVFAKYHTPEMLFITYLITWVVTFIAQYIAFKIVYNKKKAETCSVD